MQGSGRVVALVFMLLLVGVATALAAPGDLDSSFDGDGVRTVDFGSSGDSAQSVLVQPDGRIVAAGYSYGAFDFVVARLKLDGSLDTSFSGDGKTAVDFGGVEHGQAAALAPDGKIVVAGDNDNGSTSDFRIARLTPAGDLDSSFSDDGKAMVDFGGLDYASDVAVQPDGKIVVAGSVFDDLAVFRLSPDGEVEGGARRVDFGTSSRALGITLQPDGKVVVAGFATGAGGSYDIAVARYNADLSPDGSFDGDGRRTIDYGEFDVAIDVLFQPGGKIVMTGFTNSGGPAGDFDLTVTRLNPDGSLDTSFDGDGKVLFDPDGNAEGHAAALQANGKIVVAGTGGQPLLVRFQPGGALDTTFSYDGLQKLPASGYAQTVALLRDGRIVAGGGSEGDFLVALVEGDSPASGGGPGGGGPGGGGPGGGKSRVPRCAGKKATIVGTGKANRLKGTRRADVIVGLGGNDRIDGGRGNDLVCAGDGNDSVKGSTGNDRLYGQNGKDRLEGGVGKDSLAGGSGKDRLSGGRGKDSCNGGAGKDRAACERRRGI